MIRLVEADKTLTVDEIEAFMDRYDNGVFGTRKLHRKGFYLHFIRLITSGHILTFRDGMWFLKGFCSWIYTDAEEKMKINKIRWTLPENINSGDILYIPACLTTSTDMILKVRENFRSRHSDKVKAITWFNVQRGRFFSVKLKGEKKCVTVD